MAYLLDTNTSIRILNGKAPGAISRLRQSRPEEICSSSVVKAELFFGSLKSARPNENIAKQKAFVAPFHSFPFDDRAAEAYGQIRSELERKGRLIGPQRPDDRSHRTDQRSDAGNP